MFQAPISQKGCYTDESKGSFVACYAGLRKSSHKDSYEDDEHKDLSLFLTPTLCSIVIRALNPLW